eukprot:102320_1
MKAAHITALCAIVGQANGYFAPQSRPNAWEVLSNDAEFSHWCTLVQRFPDFVQQMKDVQSELTIFVPDNTAVNDARGFLDSLGPSDMEKLIGYHFVVGMGRQCTKDFTTGQLMTTEYCPTSLQSHPQMIEAYVDHKTEQIWIGNDLHIARIFKRDISCSNAMIQGVSQVLVPPENVVETPRQLPSAFPYG